MKIPSETDLATIADGMGISLYQRFTVQEASLFLRVGTAEVQKLIKHNHISFIQTSKKQIDFFWLPVVGVPFTAGQDKYPSSHETI